MPVTESEAGELPRPPQDSPSCETPMSREEQLIEASLGWVEGLRGWDVQGRKAVEKEGLGDLRRNGAGHQDAKDQLQVRAGWSQRWPLHALHPTSTICAVSGPYSISNGSLGRGTLHASRVSQLDCDHWSRVPGLQMLRVQA